jgi:HK97 family phage major capsid protein
MKTMKLGGLSAAAAAAACTFGAVLPGMSENERRYGRFLRDAGGHGGAGDGRRDMAPEDVAKEIKADFDKKFDQLKGIAEDALGKAAKGEPLAEGAKQKADEALVAVNEAKARLDELEQKMARGGSGEDDKVKSLGEQFVESDSFKAFAASGGPRNEKADLRLKTTLTSATTNAAGSLGDAVRPTRLPGIIDLPQRRMTVRDLITPGRMDGNSIEYVKETILNIGAAPVAEGATKPETDMAFDLVSTGAKVIAHWTKASRQILDDVAQLKSVIDQRLMYGLAYVEETQLLNGDGTGQNLLGIIPQATAYAAPIALADLNILDVLRLAMLQASLALFPATGHVMNPIDWATIETLKDSIGRYIIGDPQDGTTPTLWRLPVVETPAIAVRKFLTGAFKLGAQLFDRWDARVETGYVNDDFIKNLLTILGEERLALAVGRPQAFIYGDFDTALAA